MRTTMKSVRGSGDEDDLTLISSRLGCRRDGVEPRIAGTTQEIKLSLRDSAVSTYTRLGRLVMVVHQRVP